MGQYRTALAATESDPALAARRSACTLPTRWEGGGPGLEHACQWSDQARFIKQPSGAMRFSAPVHTAVCPRQDLPCAQDKT